VAAETVFACCRGDEGAIIIFLNGRKVPMSLPGDNVVLMMSQSLHLKHRQPTGRLKLTLGSSAHPSALQSTNDLLLIINHRNTSLY